MLPIFLFITTKEVKYIQGAYKVQFEVGTKTLSLYKLASFY